MIPDPLSSGVSSDSDADMDYDPDSRPSSPTPIPADSGSGVSTNPSTILVDTTTLSPEPPLPPTVEQNMAFAAFQQSGGSGAGGVG